jgi:acyl dehydratase
VTWSIVARNLPEHARNPIHTDAGARAAGFERALVAGVTSYAYALHPVIARFGMDWVERGSARVRFRSPVFDGDRVEFPVTERDDGGIDMVARVARSAAPLIELSAWPDATGAPTIGRPGEPVIAMTVELGGEYSSSYAAAAGDLDDPCARNRIVHPAVWPALANHVFHRRLVNGSWIHTRSRIRHHRAVDDGSTSTIDTTVVERFERSGSRAVAEVVIRVDGALVATIEHEAIVAVSGAPPTGRR